jgi:hypothetical protein
VTRKVVVSDCALGMGCGGSTGGNCCEAAAGNHVASAQRARRRVIRISCQKELQGQVAVAGYSLIMDKKAKIVQAIVRCADEIRSESAAEFIRSSASRARAGRSRQENSIVPSARPRQSSMMLLVVRRLRTLTGVGLYTPAQIFASPWSQPMAASCIPDKSERSQQGVSFCVKYRRPIAAIRSQGASINARTNEPPCGRASRCQRTSRRRQLQRDQSLLNRLLEAEPSCEMTACQCRLLRF